MPLLDVNNIRCSYQQQTVVNQVSFQVQQGETISLLGPSGCGKTTILRAIAGFEPIQSGSISLLGHNLSEEHFILPPEQRQLGMVFQDYALFPHLTVAENIRFGLKPDQSSRVQDMLQLTGLEAFADRYPQALSGGQQQRVALARALAPSPRLLLLDEPFSNLDATLRQQLSHELRALLKKAGISAVLVTHDQHEAFAFSDKIGLLNQGKLEQFGTPQALYQHPETAFTAAFFGDGALLRAQPDSHTLLTAAGPVASNSSQACQVFIRPTQVHLVEDSSFQGTVTKADFRGQITRLTLQLASGEQLLTDVCSENSLFPGETTGIQLDNTPACHFPL